MGWGNTSVLDSYPRPHFNRQSLLSANTVNASVVGARSYLICSISSGIEKSKIFSLANYLK